MQIIQINVDSPPSCFDRLAEIHRTEIHEGFLSTLGQRFLKTLYYEISQSPDAFILAATCNGEIAGFICGALDTGRVYRRYLLHRGLLDAWIVLPKLLSFQRFKSVVETLLYPSSRQAVDLPRAEILNFCVRKEVQGSGIGKQLFSRLTEEFQRRDITSIRIVTGATQIKAQRFYEAQGARRAAQLQIHQGKVSFAYTFNISSPLAAQAA